MKILNNIYEAFLASHIIINDKVVFKISTDRTNYKY